MGDRGNIRLEYSDKISPIWLYTHWGGSDLPLTVQRALEKGRARWGDESYLARVIFQTLIGDDNGITGYGISPYGPIDNEHPVVVIYLSEQRVGIEYGAGSWTFEEFVKLQTYSTFGDF